LFEREQIACLAEIQIKQVDREGDTGWLEATTGQAPVQTHLRSRLFCCAFASRL
jgi:hypothetical protein